MLKFVGDFLVPATPEGSMIANPEFGRKRLTLRTLLPPEYQDRAFLDPPDLNGDLRQEAARCFANVRLIERRISELSNSSFKNGEFIELEKSADSEMDLHEIILRLHRKKSGPRSLRKTSYLPTMLPKLA